VTTYKILQLASIALALIGGWLFYRFGGPGTPSLPFPRDRDGKVLKRIAEVARTRENWQRMSVMAMVAAAVCQVLALILN
jgi:hypothetical protein